MSNEPMRKTISFGEDERYLLDYALRQDDKFATYIKKLIKKDYQSSGLEDKIEQKVEEYFNKYLENHNLEVKEKATDKQVKVEFNNTDIDALKSFMTKKK